MLENVLHWMPAAYVACMRTEVVTDRAFNDAILRRESISVAGLRGRCHVHRLSRFTQLRIVIVAVVRLSSSVMRVESEYDDE
jgi:hypothetical protein